MVKIGRGKGKEVDAFLSVGNHSASNLDRNLISGISPSEQSQPPVSGKEVLSTGPPAVNPSVVICVGSDMPRGEGGVSIYSDNDPHPNVNGVCGEMPLQATVISHQQGAGRKVFDGSSSRVFPSVQAGPCGLPDKQNCLEPPKKGSVPTATHSCGKHCTAPSFHSSPVQAATACKNAQAIENAPVDAAKRRGRSYAAGPVTDPALLGGSQSDPSTFKSAEIMVIGETSVQENVQRHSMMTGIGPELIHASIQGKTDATTGPGRSYAAAVRNGKDSDSHCNSRRSAGIPSTKFPAGKTTFNRSFLDDGGTLSFGQILEGGGHKVVSFSAKELDELAAPFEFTLVGKFSHGFPSMKTIRSIMGNLNLKGYFSVSLLEQKHVLIRLSCEEDYSRIWCRQVWYMAGFPMRVLKWTPDFAPQVEAPFAPVWVIFPYLPVHLFDKRSLFTIASSIGKPLRIDSATAALTRASAPRVCIEVDVSKSLLPEVEIQLDGKIIFQPVEYEHIPFYCSCCKHLGHSSNVCKAMINSSVSDIGGNDVGKTCNEVASAVSVNSSDKNDFHKGPIEDIILRSQDGKLVLVDGGKSPSAFPVNALDISKDLYKSFDIFKKTTESEMSQRSCIQYGEESDSFDRDSYDIKNYFSEGDHDSDSAPIILPPKKKLVKSQKKQKKQKGVNKLPSPEEHLIEGVPRTGDIVVEDFSVVIGKNKKKRGKEKKYSNQDNYPG